MRRKFALFFFNFVLFIHPVSALEVVQHRIPSAEKVGEGRLTFWMWDIYDAALYAQNGRWSPHQPFALSLTYFRNIAGADIADRSIEEMRGQGFSDEALLNQWHEEMEAIFPDVKDGTTLTAIFIPGQLTEFFNGKQSIGMIDGAEFVERFSAIWLSAKTSEP